MSILLCLIFPAVLEESQSFFCGYRTIECVRVRIQTHVCLAITPFLFPGTLLLTEGRFNWLFSEVLSISGHGGHDVHQA